MTYVILQGNCLDVLKTIPSGIIQTCVTSPPYFGLRDYGVANQIGLEATPQAYVDQLVNVFREVRRTMRDDGTLWLNLGDSYANDAKWGGSSGGKHAKDLHGQTSIGRGKVETGLKAKDLIGIPWRVAFALQQDGWYLRQDIIWHKPNPMPESVRDRCTKAHEYIFLLSKSEKYFFDAEAIKEPALRPEGAGNKTHKGKTAYEDGDDKMRTKVGLTEIGAREFRNKRSVWSVTPKPFKEAHFATFPPDLIRPCILAGAPKAVLVLDPFGGAGTTALVSESLGRHSISIELNPDYVTMARSRVEAARPLPIAAE